MSNFSGSNDDIEVDTNIENVYISDEDEVASLEEEEVEKRSPPPTKRKKDAPSSSSSKQKKPPLHPTEGGSSSQRVRKKKSKWWVHYEDTSDPDAARCSHCDLLIGCKGTNGTTPLKNHAQRCK
ncbi:hypothetical protein RND71_029725 [Anisodus tanguticus]|uniref:BED-type domain-containing protein n=1 Tax=Anisodus tanguticus TaxID=243964 RepID=A0AAE1RGE3_9SOLA|nr:hypothetical protein RND71_029725 [Anisodus tanguticus]